MTDLIDKDEYVAHIRDLEEVHNMRRILDLVDMVKRDHMLMSTDFLTPYTRSLARPILDDFLDISYKEISGNKQEERKVILIYPDYHYLMEEDYTISALRLTGDTSDLTHPDFLGGILGLGISRDKLGDIYIHDGYADIVIKDEIKDFILLNLKKISNKNFSLEEIDLSELESAFEDFEEFNRTLSALRLDAYIGASYNLSRGASRKLIESGKVKVNWEAIDKASFELKEGDMISTGGYGRSKLHSIEGLSKKDRIIVKIRKLL